MQIKKVIPHLFTLGNLSCGCISIYMSLTEGNLIYAAVFVFGGMFLDFFDGLAARLLKVPGEFGKQLDSLADMVTFGVAPAALLSAWFASSFFNGSFVQDLFWAPLLLALFSAVRLAKFNIDTRQTTSFMGLPTPANAIFWIMLPFASHESYVAIENLTSLGADIQHLSYEGTLFSNPWWVLLLIPIFSILMIVDIPLFALKVKNLKWADNKIQFIFLALVAVVLIASFVFAPAPLIAFPIIVFLYLVLSIITNAISKSR